MSKTILLIDDDQLIREVASASLERIGGFRVLTATNGPEGLEVAERELPDAVVLDVMMPEMDGPSTLAALRSKPTLAGIPVVFLTAKAGTSEHDRLMGLGATGVLVKPFDPLELPGQISALVGFES